MKRIHWKMGLLLLVLVLPGCSLLGGPFTGPDNVKIADPVRAVADARRVIEEHRKSGSGDHDLIEPNRLPESLRIPGLRYAFVSNDHLSLILARNPDWEIGARIWSLDSTTKHNDEKTKYPEVFFFRYCNDNEKSPGNLL